MGFKIKPAYLIFSLEVKVKILLLAAFWGDNQPLFTGFSDKIFDRFIAKPIFPVPFMDMVFEGGKVAFGLGSGGGFMVNPPFIGGRAGPAEQLFEK